MKFSGKKWQLSLPIPVILVALGFLLWKTQFFLPDSPEKLKVGTRPPEFTPADCESNELPDAYRDARDWESLELHKNYCLEAKLWQSRVSSDPEAWCSPVQVARFVIHDNPAADFLYEYCPDLDENAVMREIEQLERQQDQDQSGIDDCSADVLAEIYFEDGENEGQMAFDPCSAEVNFDEVMDALTNLCEMAEQDGERLPASCQLADPQQRDWARREAERRAEERRHEEWQREENQRQHEQAEMEREALRQNTEDVFSCHDSGQITFGTLCQHAYSRPPGNSYDWCLNVPSTAPICSGFHNTLDDGGDYVGRFSLRQFDRHNFVDNSHILEDGGVDSVDILYVITHGGSFASRKGADGSITRPPYVGLTDQNCGQIRSHEWRFGDHVQNQNDPYSPAKTGILSLIACSTMKQDSELVDRWMPAFRGGLIIATGSHKKIQPGPTTREMGEDYAMELRRGATVWEAWKYGMTDWYEDMYMMAIASGTSAENFSDCYYVLDVVKGTTVSDWVRIRDRQVKSLCWYYYNDD